MRHKDWRLYSKNDDNIVKTMISDKNVFCVKSTTVVQGSIENVFDLVMDLSIKPKYDDTFEYGQHIQPLPLETSIEYSRFRRILIISPRDMVFASKVFRVNNGKEIYIVGKSILLES
jgi:hypothetical protein